MYLPCSKIHPGYGECHSDVFSRDYRGIVDTMSGTTCQKWTSQSPHIHTNTPENRPNTGLGDHNYCRNPQGDPGGVWCYTTDINIRWDFCDIGVPNTICDGKGKYLMKQI